MHYVAASFCPEVEEMSSTFAPCFQICASGREALAGHVPGYCPQPCLMWMLNKNNLQLADL